MSPVSPDKPGLDAIRNEIADLERQVQHALAQGDHALSELRGIKERLAKLEEKVATLKHSISLCDLNA